MDQRNSAQKRKLGFDERLAYSPGFNWHVGMDNKCSANGGDNLDSTISTQRPKDANFTVSYLVESCGLAPQAAKCLQLGFSDNLEALRLADGSKAVIEIFNHHGFHDYHIARLLLKKPQFFSADPDKELGPKVELLASLGVHPISAAAILLNFPSQHLQDWFIPFVDFLTSVHFSSEEVVEMMVYFCHKAGFDPQSFLGNMTILRKVGMSNSNISYLIRTEYCHINEKFMLFESGGLFEKIVDEVKAMGLNPKICVFVDAILAISTIGIETYKRNSKVFKKWGWSDAKLLKAFIEQPQFLDHKEKKIDEVMDCLLKTLQCPLAFTCSTKKLISRFSVVKFIWEKGLIDVDRYKMSSILEKKEEHLFVERFMIKLKEIVPKLFHLYSQCKTDGKPFYAI
ncbi:hypothetical protein QQ045_003177 [Rhodiola kirilowii]